VANKPNFTKSAEENLKPSSPVRRRVEAKETPEEPETAAAQKPNRAADVVTRINFNITPEMRKHLDAASWENHQNVTQYLNALIEADMKKRKK